MQQLMDSSSIWVHETDMNKMHKGPASAYTRIVHGRDNPGLEHKGFEVWGID